MAVGTHPWFVAPSWTPSNQPTVTTVGMIGFNLDTNEFEGYDGSAWVSLTGGGGGGGGGDNITVNSVAVTDANFSNSVPTAPASSLNITWQRSGSSPTNISAYFGYGAGLDVSGGALVVGTGAIATAMIADEAVTFAKMQDVSTNTLLGRWQPLSGDLEEIALGTEFTSASGTLKVKAFTGDVTKLEGDTVLSIAPDAVTTTHLAGYSYQLVTAVGATAITIPTAAQYVRIVCVGSGGNGDAGVVGNNTANRNGGRGGGGGGFTEVTYRRKQLPATLNCWVADANGGAANAQTTLVQANTGYAGGAVASSLYAEIFCYASSGGSGGLGTGAGAAVAILANMLPSKLAAAFRALSGTSASTPTSGTVASVSPFGGGSATSASTSQGCTGAGKTTTVAAAGQGYTAFGATFPAVAGGAIASNGAAGTYHGGDPITTALADPGCYLLGYGGTAGGSNLAGAGGTGGAGALGCGGGGGGAGTAAGGAGGAGGKGFIIVETW